MINKLYKKEDFIVECSVCGQTYQNWAGSTPCCGALAFIIDYKLIERNKKLKLILNKLNNYEGEKY